MRVVQFFVYLVTTIFRLVFYPCFSSVKYMLFYMLTMYVRKQMWETLLLFSVILSSSSCTMAGGKVSSISRCISYNISWLQIKTQTQLASRVKRIYYLRSGKHGSRGVQGVDSGTQWCHESPRLFFLNAFSSWASTGLSAAASAPGSQMVQQFIHFPDATTTRRKQTLLPSWSARKTFQKQPPTHRRCFLHFLRCWLHDMPMTYSHR